MSQSFDACFAALMTEEGGYSNNPADPGGETNFGICKRSYPALDIRALTQEGAKAIYLRDYWGPLGCDALPAALALVMFDTGVNSGLRAARGFLLGSASDWRVFLADRLEFMTNLGTWSEFGRGWARRISSLAKQAAALDAAMPGAGRVFLTSQGGTVVPMTDQQTTYSGALIVRHADGAVSISRSQPAAVQTA